MRGRRNHAGGSQGRAAAWRCSPECLGQGGFSSARFGALLLFLVVLLCALPGTTSAYETGLRLAPPDAGGFLPVAAVLPGSPAEKAGLRVGDLLVEVDGDVLPGKTPSEVQTHLERRLSGGWSCLVVLVRDGAPDVVRLRGTYTTFAQQRVLDCAEALRAAARRGDVAWEESLRFVAGMRDAGFPEEPLPAVQEEARRALRESLRELAAVPLPEGVSPEAQRLLAEARDRLGRAQRFREEALALLGDWKAREAAGTSSSARWKAWNDMSALADRARGRGRAHLLEALALVGMDARSSASFFEGE